MSDPELLSRRVARRLEAERAKGPLLVSSISAWEFLMLIKKDRLVVNMDEVAWLRKAEQLPFLRFVPVDNEIARLAVQLPEPLHGDSADRMIVATARATGAILVTKDKRLLQYSHVQTLW